jgi:hypothetical protein
LRFHAVRLHPSSFRCAPLASLDGPSDEAPTVHPRTKKIAAALAAVESFLAEEAHASAVFGMAAGSPARVGPSPWVLAGRLALMSSRMGAAPRGPRNR